MKKIIAILLVLATALSLFACAGNGGGTAVTTDEQGNPVVDPAVAEHKYKKGELELSSAWIKEAVESDDLFTFKYDGVSLSKLLESGWERKYGETTDADGNTVGTLTYSGDNVSAVATIIIYKNLPTVDWVVRFTNNGEKSSKAISNVLPLAAYFTGYTEDAKLGYASGSLRDATKGDQEFETKSFDFKDSKAINATSEGGRSSQNMMPYFDLCDGNKGVLCAIGWTGNWKANIEKIGDGMFYAEAGQESMNTVLFEDESFRTPSIVLTFGLGNQDDIHNNYRYTYFAEYGMKDENGKVVTELPLSINTWGSSTEETMLASIEHSEEIGYDYDILWVDAGWHGDELSADTYDSAWSRQVGSWYPNTEILPNGFKNVSAKLKEYGKKLLVWFEPERVYKGSDIYKNYPGYIIKLDNNNVNAMYDLSNEEATDYLINLIGNILKDNGIGWYRQDFNFEPAAYWAKKDKDTSTKYEPRTGITEAHYIEGLYKYLDGIIAMNPGLLIDNCASGGKRLDIEMMKRSVPLWRSDYYVNGQSAASNEVCRLISFGLNYWVPISCGGNGGVTDTYEYRSVIGSGMTLGAPYSNIDWWIRRTSEYKTLRTYFTYNYYMLNMPTRSKTNYLTKPSCFEYYSPENGKGVIMAFHPETCTSKSLSTDLKGLDPNATYKLTCPDNGETEEMDGYSLMNGGFKINFEYKKQSVIVYFEKIA